MGKVIQPERAMLFIGMLYADSAVLNDVQPMLEREFGEALLVSPAVQWEYSEYYRNELGWPILRQFVFYKNAIDPGALAEIKIWTNEIEDYSSADNKRRVNLDPGYLTLSKVVLASTKNYAHRLYLGKGIYGELTLYYQDGMFKPHLFTYRDYQKKSCVDMFMNARALMRQQLSERTG